jgi:hypothetical protein
MPLSIGLDLPDDLTREDWETIAAHIEGSRNGYQWWYVDWYAHSCKHYGDGVKAAKKLGVPYGTLRNWVVVARRLPLSFRHDGLTFEHHIVVAMVTSLQTPEERFKWLSRAHKQKWSAARLRKEVKDAEDGSEIGQDDSSDSEVRDSKLLALVNSAISAASKGKLHFKTFERVKPYLGQLSEGQRKELRKAASEAGWGWWWEANAPIDDVLEHEDLELAE